MPCTPKASIFLNLHRGASPTLDGAALIHCEMAVRPARRASADQCKQHSTAACAAAAVAEESRASGCCSRRDRAVTGTIAASWEPSFPSMAAEKNGEAAATADVQVCEVHETEGGQESELC